MSRDLKPAEIEQLATLIVNQEPTVLAGEKEAIKPEDLSDASRIELGNVVKDKQKIKDDLDATKAAEKENQTEEVPHDPALDNLLPGGIAIPEGFEHIGTITAGHEEGSNRIDLDDLEPNHQMWIQSSNVSVTFNRGAVDKEMGYLEGRIIHDGGGSAYVFRKDDWKTDTTYFQVAFTTQQVPK